MLGITCARECGCGLLLKVMTIACALITSEGRSSARVGDMSYGRWGVISPSNCFNLLWLVRPCLLITGLYAFHPSLVCLKTLFCFLD